MLSVMLEWGEKNRPEDGGGMISFDILFMKRKECNGQNQIGC